jgi:uncharacterized protein YndB with AHSA1/START domain
MSEDLLGALRPDDDRVAAMLERSYPTGAEDLWSALTDPARLARWFARVEGDLRLGGTFCIYFDDENPDERTLGQVQACEPPRFLEVTWYSRDEGESLVRAELTEESGGTRLSLDHRRLPRGAAAGYGAGWQTYLEQLGEYLAGDAGRGTQWDERWKQLLPRYQAQLAALSEGPR